MEQNQTPYAPPRSAVAATGDAARRLIPASKWLRLANFLIDYLVYTFISIVIGGLVVLVFGQAGAHVLQSIPGFIIGMPIIFGYYLVFEASLGRTPGKFVTGTIVVDRDGLTPTFKQIVGRSLTRLIPFEAITFLSSTRRGWHDRLPDTYVIRCR